MQHRAWLAALSLAVGVVACDDEQGDTKAVTPADAKTADAKTADAKTADAKTADAKTADAKTADAKTADAKTADAKAADAKSPDAKAADAKSPDAKAADAKAPSGPVFVDGNIDLSFESVGELHVGMTPAEVEAKLGKPSKTTKIQEEGATGEFVQTWRYPAAGIEVGLSATTKNGAQTVRSLSAGPTCKLPLGWGLAIGSTRAEVEAIYGSNFEAETTTPETFVAGSIYGGAIYTFVDGKVTHLFLGAAAE
ncbi:MAG: hypothetical protein IPH07_26505 [Deltaproteobacteria bacterium]|nr:hypothetical protein [Deltaproteobacteria bacterium]MBK8718312.1 hypothetical protein [Deltaproteobacteria bacterium]MBP7291463.1 hypothetical protein [Nannocystaceae bacterium]